MTYTIEDARVDAMCSAIDYDEDDLDNLTKEEFCKKYHIPGEEWDMLQKEIQEM